MFGILISEEKYILIKEEINQVKTKFWYNKNVIFHTGDIRKCNNEFQILFDLDIKRNFYEFINSIVEKPFYDIIVAYVNKIEFIKKYGKLENDVYEISLSFILERTVFCLDSFGNCSELEIIIKKRGKNEYTKLAENFQKVRQVGTYYVKGQRIQDYGFKSKFFWKNEKINGLQLSDLIAYPIARRILNPQGVNLSFEKIKHNFYMKNGKIYGLKKFP